MREFARSLSYAKRAFFVCLHCAALRWFCFSADAAANVAAAAAVAVELGKNLY